MFWFSCFMLLLMSTMCAAEPEWTPWISKSNPASVRTNFEVINVRKKKNLFASRLTGIIEQMFKTLEAKLLLETNREILARGFLKQNANFLAWATFVPIAYRHDGSANEFLPFNNVQFEVIGTITHPMP